MTADVQMTPEQIQALLARLEEAEETLAAIRNGEVDGLVVAGAHGDQVFTRKGSDHLYRVMIETMDEGAATLGADGTILFCNRRFASMLRLPHAQVLGASMAQFLTPACQVHFAELLACRLDAVRIEMVLQAGDGTQAPVSLACSALPEDESECLCIIATDLTAPKQAEATIRQQHEELERRVQERTMELAQANTALREEIVARKRIEHERETTVELLRLVTGSKDLRELAQVAVTFFREQSGCEAVGLRLRDGEDYPYFETHGFPPEFVQMETHLCSYDADGQIVRDSSGNPALDCMCGNILCGRFDPAQSFFTENGSFCSNHTTALLASTTETERQARTRNRCNGAGYESVALLPLHVGTERLGLLQLNDRRQGMFNAEAIALWERLADHLAVVLAKLRAEQALREREATLRGILDAVKETIWLFSADGIVLLGNSTALQRYDKTEAEVIGKHIRANSPPALAETRLARIRQVIDSGQPLEFEDERAGIQFQHSFYPVFDDDGRVEAIASFSRDITERKQAEEALQESEERYRALFNDMTEGFAIHEIVTDEQGTPLDWRFLDINPAFERLTGLKREEVVGHTHNEVLPGDDPKWLRMYGAVALTGEPVQFENYSPALERHYEVLAYSPAPRQFAVIFMDITERKQAEEAVQHSESLLRAITDNSPDPIFLKDHHGRLLFANPATLRAIGKPATEVIGKTDEEFYANPAVGRAITANDRRILESGRDEVVEEVILNPDGSTCIYLSRKSLFYDAQGQIIGIVGVAHDITERKLMEEALQASLREKDVLLKEIHHRVKNNMQVISSLVSLQADTLDNPALRPLFNDLRDRVRTMALVHEKLYQSDSLARVNFAEYTRSLLAYLWRAHGEATADVRLTLDLQPVSLTVETAVPCGLMLNELVTNALKHAFHDRIDGELTVALHADADGKVCLSVRDNGVGLPADWRQSPSLGLQLVQMLTGQVRGTLDVRSDGGTAFTLTFMPPSQS